MRHVVAPDVYVLHRGGASFGVQAETLRKRGHRLILDRYPQLDKAVSEYLERADGLRTLFLRILLADRRNLRLLVDGRVLGARPTGTSTVSLELVRALSALPQLEVSVVTQSPGILHGIVPDNIRVISLTDLQDHLSRYGRFDCVFRGSQTSRAAELVSLWDWAHRVVVLQLDFIAYENLHYHVTAERFFEYRDSAILTALTADAIFGLSRFVLAQGSALGVPLDATASVLGSGAPPVSHRAVEVLSRHLVLVLGASFRHKNRLYALRLLERLSASGIECDMALVGPEPVLGSSEADEDVFVREHPGLASRIERYDWLPEDALDELWTRASVVLYPSLSEGFGLIPFEAAARGVPSLFGRRTGLAEVYPDTPFSLGFRSVEEDAGTLRLLLEEELARTRQVDYIQRQAEAWSWQDVAARLVARLWEVCVSPPKIPSEIRWRLHTARRGQDGLVLRLRRSPIGLKLLPAGSARAAAVRRLLPRRLQ